MADLGFDGMIKVSFVPSIADIASPKISELTAGVSLECRLTPDGLATPADTAEIDNSKLCSTSNSAIVGRRTFSGLMVKYVRDDSDTEALEVEATLVYKAPGFLVVRRDLVATAAWAAGQKVEVYPVQCKQPNPDSPAGDSLQAVEVGFTNTKAPKAYGDFATVAAS